VHSLFFQLFVLNCPVLSRNLEKTRASYFLSVSKSTKLDALTLTLAADNLQAYCSILARVNNLSYEPTIFIGTHTINNTDKLRLMFTGQGKRISNPIDTTVLGFIQNAKKFKSTTLGRRVGLTFWLLCGRNL